MHLTLTTATLVALLSSASALLVTGPALGSTLDLSKDNKITWTSVNTDPASFNIVLVNNQVNPSVSIPIAENVETSAGSYDLKAVNGASPGNGYTFNLESSASQNSGILAQSQQFAVAQAGARSTSSAPFTSGATTSPTSTGMSTSSPTSSNTATTTTITTETTSSDSTPTGSTKPTGSPTTSTTKSATAAASSGAASSLNALTGAGFLAMIAALLA